MSEWIPVSERLPEDKDKNQTTVLVVCMNDINDYSWPYRYEEACHLAFRSNGKWWLEEWPEEAKEDNIIYEVTHWMPLPPPPETDNE